jgi:hypothetical protein
MDDHGAHAGLRLVTGRAQRAALVVVLVGGVVACKAAIPTPTRPPTPSAQPSPTQASATSEPSAPALPSAPESREPAGDLGQEIEILSLDRAWTRAILEFASDGESIIYSTSDLTVPPNDFAPDLWRYRPGADQPELLWRNPLRDRVLPNIGGELGTWAFVDMPVSGERAWNFWLLPHVGAEAILLDSHPGDESVPSWVPSFNVHQGQIAWTSFDLGPGGPVSQLLYARAPDWTPTVVLERDARIAELWLPSMRDTDLVFCEVVYSEDHSTDERHVYVMDVAMPEVAPRRLDQSGLATMPLALWNGGIVWKEAGRGFNMFNWGRLFHYDEETGEITSLPTRPQAEVNYPSAGTRFIAAWGATSGAFGVYDLDLRATRLIDQAARGEEIAFLRPHIHGDLLVWLQVEGIGERAKPLEIRYAFMPPAGSDRLAD